MSDLPLSAFADINPPVRMPKGLVGTAAVSFIPMSDVSESGQWTVRQTRPLRSVGAGFTTFEDGDVLVAKITPCMENGKGTHATGLQNGIGFGSTEFHVLRAKSGNLPRFIFHLTQWRKFRHAAESQMVGSAGQRRVPRQFFEAFPVANFNEAAQAQIVEVLDTFDTAIHETEAIIAKLKAVKQGLLHDLLTRGIDANSELRPPQAEAPHLYKESSVGWIPIEWDVETLESVSTAVTSGSRDWARFYADSGAVFVRIGNLTREHINFRFESTIYVRPPRNADGQRTRLELGDILVSITADLGIVGVVSDGLGEAYINQHIALVRPNFKAINPRFIGHYLGGPVSQAYISKLNDGGAKAGLNLPTIRGLLTVVPIREEQDMIAARLDEIDKRIQNALLECVKLQELKAGLMDDLLTGRVRVTPLLEGITP
jgi:type I restriction enzyme S subunit